MASHLNVSSTYGITLPSGAVAESVKRSRKIETDKMVGTSGEYSKFDAHHTKAVEVTIEGKGPAGLDGVTSATVGTPSTLKITKAEQKEANKGRAGFSLTALGHEDYDDADSAAAIDGAEPDIDSLVITSVTHAVAQTLTKSSSVTDKTELGVDGKPALRATCQKLNAFSSEGKGDIPAAVALGTGGAGIAGLTGGKLIVSQLDDDQKNGEWNGYSFSGEHCPSAA